jgi:hypothetical protein
MQYCLFFKTDIMKKPLKLLSIIALLLFTSCATNVKTKKYKNIDFKNFETFAYLPNTAFKAEAFNNNSDTSVEESLIEALNTKMAEKGFSVNKDQPDLLVLLTTSNQIKSNTRNNNKYQQAPVGGGSSSSSPNYATVNSSDYRKYFKSSNDEVGDIAYKSGTLVVEIFSSQSKELLWVGIAEDFKAHISDQTLKRRMINEIFKEFPI